MEQSIDRALLKITCGVHEAISSIKLEFNDGVVSPTFGKNKEQQLNCCLEVPDSEDIVGLQIRHKASSASI